MSRLLRVSTFVFAMLLPIAAYTAWEYIEVGRLVVREQRIAEKGEPVTVQAVTGTDKLLSPQSEASHLYRAAAALTTYKNERLNEEALAMLDRAVALPFEGSPPGYDYNYFGGDLMRLAELATKRTAAFIASADRSAAVESLVAEAILLRARMRQLHEAMPILPSRFLSNVNAVLGNITPDAAALERLGAALAPLDIDDAFRLGLLVRRAEYLDLRLPPWRFPGSGLPPWRLHVRNRAVDTLSAQIEAASLPWPSRLDALGVTAAWTEKSWFNNADYSGGPDSQETLRLAAGFRAQTLAWNLSAMRVMRLAVAIERYRRDHGGQIPPTLDALSPQYLPAALVDPYSGRSFAFKVEPDGYVVYSVGTNRSDDGADVGAVFPRTYVQLDSARDLGVRFSTPNP
jgi:hypothetical protein